VLLGAAIALGGVAVYRRLQPDASRLRNRPGAALALLGHVFMDIVRSNIAVARIVLGLAGRKRTAGFIKIPMQLRHPGGLAVIACIITATPGTSWVRYDRAENVITIHILDLVDEQTWIHQFKQRYERNLLEIFE
jgi:multicomponent K+:H+ antiporter subunit E